MVRIYYEKDANLDFIKRERIAVIGYGSQGRGQALNLKDSGCNVFVGLREGSSGAAKVREDGLEVYSIRKASKEASMIVMLIPDEFHSEVYEKDIKAELDNGKMLIFAHGFSIHYSQVNVDEGIDVGMVAPKSPGNILRREYQAGRGVPALLAIERDYTGKAKDKALSYAKGIGATRAGVIETTFKEEAETDIFGEQAVLCGGLTALMKAGFETLVQAGYQPEVAYFECINEMKLIVDLIYEGGFSFMCNSISNTAEYGTYISQDKIITEEVRNNMKRILSDIQTGEFANKWILENKAKQPTLRAMRKLMQQDYVEEIGVMLRKMMPWINQESKKN